MRQFRMTRLLPFLALAALACGGDSPTAPNAPDTGGPCVVPAAPCAERLEIRSGEFLPLFRTHALSAGDPEVTRAVIVIHGTNRDADNYFETMVMAARQAGVLERTVVVSPHFQTRSDGPAPDEPYWTSSGWKRGNPSEPEGPSPRVSSYEALDRLLETLADRSRFPALARIVVTGHSAGGQVVHRYAATSRVEQMLSGVSVRYVVANPSTYLYLGSERSVGDGWRVPAPDVCPDYNDWHYGLDHRNDYAAALAADSIRSQLVRRDVVILLGDADRGTHLLDQSCGANLQGPYRYARGLTLVDFMNAFYPGNHHRLSVVEGVGHSSRDMYTSQVGKGALFEP